MIQQSEEMKCRCKLPQTDLGNIMQSERSQSQKNSVQTEMVRVRQIYTESRFVW